MARNLGTPLQLVRAADRYRAAGAGSLLSPLWAVAASLLLLSMVLFACGHRPRRRVDGEDDVKYYGSGGGAPGVAASGKKAGGGVGPAAAGLAVGAGVGAAAVAVGAGSGGVGCCGCGGSSGGGGCSGGCGGGCGGGGCGGGCGG